MLALRALILGFAVCVAARATTVVPPSFDELVGTSELVFRGNVVEVAAGWVGTGKQQRIATRVTFAVEKCLRGDAGDRLVLEFLGGVVGQKALILSGWPTFAVGDRGIFFVENRGSRACPLVRLRHGRYRIVREATSSANLIVKDDLTPLRTVAEVAAPLRDASSPARAAAPGAGLTMEEFEAQIAARSAQFPLAVRPSR